MSPKVITAVYENGVLRPLEELDLPENELLYLLIIELSAEESNGWYELSQASLARVWDHPEEDIYTLEDGEPI